MYCPNCGTNIADDSAFCFNCGFRITRNGAAPAATPAPVPAVANKKVSVALAVILSMIIPGTGQMYLGHIGRGLTILLLSVASILLFPLLALVLWLYGIINAYSTAKAMQRP